MLTVFFFFVWGVYFTFDRFQFYDTCGKWRNFWSGDTLGSPYWVHVCWSCSQPAGHSRFRAPLHKNALSSKQPRQQTTTGVNNQSTVTQSDRTSLRDISNNVPIEFDHTTLIWLTAFWFCHVIGWLDVCVDRTGGPNSRMTIFHTVLQLYFYVCYITADVVNRPWTACCRKWRASKLAW